jgi:hypothetical protein
MASVVGSCLAASALVVVSSRSSGGCWSLVVRRLRVVRLALAPDFDIYYRGEMDVFFQRACLII